MIWSTSVEGARPPQRIPSADKGNGAPAPGRVIVETFESGVTACSVAFARRSECAVVMLVSLAVWRARKSCLIAVPADSAWSIRHVKTALLFLFLIEEVIEDHQGDISKEAHADDPSPTARR